VEAKKAQGMNASSFAVAAFTLNRCDGIAATVATPLNQYYKV
jgi:hypothetical protein